MVFLLRVLETIGLMLFFLKIFRIYFFLFFLSFAEIAVFLAACAEAVFFSATASFSV